MQDVGVVGEFEELAGFSQADAVQRGEIITTGQDAHVAELLLGENVAQGAAAAQVALNNLQPVPLLIHLQYHLQTERERERVTLVLSLCTTTDDAN